LKEMVILTFFYLARLWIPLRQGLCTVLFSFFLSHWI
jgi:hypothetical protein